MITYKHQKVNIISILLIELFRDDTAMPFDFTPGDSDLQ